MLGSEGVEKVAEPGTQLEKQNRASGLVEEGSLKPIMSSRRELDNLDP